mmetsp:Transcript_44746/g.89343  ORF Transcript_44746/g.89343 Transcript_44746/m.89343 type:complete len:323 (+) Transcript_44746:1186-2154(+)
MEASTTRRHPPHAICSGSRPSLARQSSRSSPRRSMASRPFARSVLRAGSSRRRSRSLRAIRGATSTRTSPHSGSRCASTSAQGSSRLSPWSCRSSSSTSAARWALPPPPLGCASRTRLSSPPSSSSGPRAPSSFRRDSQPLSAYSSTRETRPRRRSEASRCPRPSGPPKAASWCRTSAFATVPSCRWPSATSTAPLSHAPRWASWGVPAPARRHSSRHSGASSNPPAAMAVTAQAPSPSTASTSPSSSCTVFDRGWPLSCKILCSSTTASSTTSTPSTSTRKRSCAPPSRTSSSIRSSMLCLRVWIHPWARRERTSLWVSDS